jgi:hypothetical protein
MCDAISLYYISTHGYDFLHPISTSYMSMSLLLELMLDTSSVEAPRTYVLCICIQMQITYMHTCRGSASMFCHHACLYSDSLANPYIVIKHQKGGD